MENDTVEYIKDEIKKNVTFEYSHQDDNSVLLRCEIDGEVISVVSIDCDHCFREIREKLGDDYVFLCQGAKPNFVLSAMASQAGGFQGYVVQIGLTPSFDNVRRIFDPAPLAEIGTVKEQIEFRRRFFAQFDNAS